MEGRRRLAHRRLRAGRRGRPRARRHPQRGASPDRLPLPLCLRHADRGRRLHHLLHVRGALMMTNWPILSVVTFLPLLGAVLIMVLAQGNSELAKGTSRWVAFWTTLVTFAISLVLVQRFDPSSAEFQFVEKAPWLGIANYH